MANAPFLVSTYARNVYLTGKTKFAGIPASYVADVKGYAAKNFYIDDIDAALENGWITQAEHDETLALKGPTDPQYRPAVTAATEAPTA